MVTEEESEDDKKKPAAPPAKRARVAKSSEESSEEESSSSEEEDSSSDDDSEDEDEARRKKAQAEAERRRKSLEAAMEWQAKVRPMIKCRGKGEDVKVHHEFLRCVLQAPVLSKSPSNNSEERKRGEAFRRVDDDFWRNQIKHDALKDNSCEYNEAEGE